MSLRKSLQKSLEKSFFRGRFGERAGIVDTRDSLSNEIVQYRGVSLQALVDLWEKTLCHDVVPETTLYVLVEDVEDVAEGTTVRLEKTQRNGVLDVFVPYRAGNLSVHESQVSLKKRTDWTIEDMCEHVVLPLTVAKKCFYLDLLPPEAVGAPFKGAFVSQARATSFGGLLHALKSFYAHSSKSPDEIFLWLDLFSANQPLLSGKDPDEDAVLRRKRWELLTYGLHDALFLFEERLIFFNSWDNPYPLRRAWCVWEIYGAAVTGKDLNLIFDPAAESDMLDKLFQGPNTLLNAIAKLDPREIECRSVKDLEMIQQAVENLPEGFSTLKARITERLRTWMVKTVKDAVEKEEQSRPKSEYFAQLLNLAGLFFLALGDKKQGLAHYLRALQLFMGCFGPDHLSCANVLTNVGVALMSLGEFEAAAENYEKAIGTYTKLDMIFEAGDVFNNFGELFREQGKWEEALEMYEKALQIKEQHLGIEHPSTAETLNNIPIVYYSLGKYDEAYELYTRALEVKKKTLGERHPSTADTLNNMGILLLQQEKFEQALEMFNLVLEIKKETLGERHPDLGAVYNNIGEVYLQQAKYTQAMEMYEMALSIKLESLGDRHPSTADTYFNIGQVFQEQGEQALAHESYEIALSIYKEKLGPNHPFTIETQQLVQETE